MSAAAIVAGVVLLAAAGFGTAVALLLADVMRDTDDPWKDRP